jgi:zinc transport system substrate-binding protein
MHVRTTTVLQVIVVVVVLAAVLICDRSMKPGDGVSGLPIVLVSVEPQAYFVERLAGELVEIVVLVPPGASPATHEPTMQQMQAVEQAALYVKVGHPGFPFERTWLDRLLGDRGDLPVVDCSAHVDLHAGGEHGSTSSDAHDHGHAGDPHVWLSPVAVRAMVPDIAAALATIMPARRATIEASRDSLLADIDRLDADIRAVLAGVTQRRFYVFHPAWGRFAADYGLEQVAIETGGKEPDPHTLAELAEQARAEGVPVIFVQPQFSRRSAEVMAAEVGAHVVPLDPLARDWLDNLRRAAMALRGVLGSSSGPGASDG